MTAESAGNRARRPLPHLHWIMSARIVEQSLVAILSAHELKKREWLSLVAIASLGAATQRAIVDASGLDKVAVNRACATLGGRGLIARHVNDADLRSYILELTHAGAALLRRVTAAIESEERRLFSIFTERQRGTLAEMFRKLEAAASLAGPKQSGSAAGTACRIPPAAT